MNNTFELCFDGNRVVWEPHERSLAALEDWLRANPAPEVKPTGNDNACQLVFLVTPTHNSRGYGHIQKIEVAAVHGLQFDLDKGTLADFQHTLAAIAAAGYGALVWESHSSTEADPAGRAILLYDSPCPPQDHERVYRVLASELAPGFNTAAQLNCNRGWNRPRASTEITELPGALVDWRAVLERAPAPQPAAAPAPAPDARPLPDGTDLHAWAERFAPQVKPGQKERAVYALSGYLARRGMQQTDTETLVDAILHRLPNVQDHAHGLAQVAKAYDGLAAGTGNVLGFPALRNATHDQGAIAEALADLLPPLPPVVEDAPTAPEGVEGIWLTELDDQGGVSQRSMADVNAEAIAVFARNPHVYLRGPEWVIGRPEHSGGGLVESSFAVTAHLLARSTQFLRHKPSGGQNGAPKRVLVLREPSPPKDTVLAVRDAPQASAMLDLYAPHARMVAASVECPVLRPDGTVAAPVGGGWDRATGLLFGASTPSYEPAPSVQEAKATIDDLLGDFRVAQDGYAPVVAAFLTACARLTLHLQDAAAPGVLISAGNGGAGKTLLAETILAGSGCALDFDACKIAWSIRNPDAVEKHMHTSVRNGRPALYFDNLPTGSQFSHPTLDAWVTARSKIEFRVLQYTESFAGPWVQFCIATGNNISFGGETGRRWLKIRIVPPELDADADAPAQSIRYRRSEPQLRAYARSNWARLRAAGLAILQDVLERAADPDALGLAPVASFAEWRALVGVAVARHWGVDPCLALQPELDEAESGSEFLNGPLALLCELSKDGAEPVPLTQVPAKECGAPLLMAARGDEHYNPRKLGYVLRSLQDRRTPGVDYIVVKGGRSGAGVRWGAKRTCSSADHAAHVAEARPDPVGPGAAVLPIRVAAR